MDKIAAVEDIDSGEISEGRIDEVVVIPHTADARVGIKSGDDRVCESRTILGC